MNGVFIFFKNKFRLNREIVVEIISGLFFLLFLHTAIDKLIDFQKFKVQLGQSPILTAYASSIAWMIPSIEITVSILLIPPITRLFALYTSYSLMVMFTAYIIVIMNFTERIPCSCGGIFEGMLWREHLIVNLGFVLVGIIGILLQANINKEKKLPQANIKISDRFGRSISGSRKTVQRVGKKQI